ncbi:MAG TPA: xanthine dehydrogenase family protein subunit M [Syntrophorhabdales bacterium]|nr:xanthine dehydrogenase family protein subunit M [Syntrophorhabdales bacterium]
MKDFEYYAPKTVKEAVSLLGKLKGDAKIIAGGQSMLVLMKQNMIAPENVIDIKGLSELDYMKYDAARGLLLGALTTHRTIEKSPMIKERYPVLAEMEDNLAAVQTRNYGTIGGNVCHGDPAGDPSTVFVALDAKLKLAGAGGERLVNTEDFYKDYLEVDLKEDEMLTEIQVPNIPANTGVAHEKLMFQKADMGIVGAAASITVNPSSGACEAARIALSNVASVPFRSKAAEKALVGKVLNDKVIEEAAEAMAKEISPPSDVHGSEAYRKEMVKVFLKRTVKKALERAKAKS